MFVRLEGELSHKHINAVAFVNARPVSALEHGSGIWQNGQSFFGHFSRHTVMSCIVCSKVMSAKTFTFTFAMPAT